MSSSASSSASLAGPPKSRVTAKPKDHTATEEKEKQFKDIDVLLESMNSTIARYEEHLQVCYLNKLVHVSMCYNMFTTQETWYCELFGFPYHIVVFTY